MRKLNLLFMFLLISTFGYSQKLHSPEEILKLVSNSKLSYNVNAINMPIVSKDFSNRLNINNVYRVSTEAGLSILPYSMNEKAKSPFERAENHLKASNFKGALVWYRFTLMNDSSLFYVMTYVGQMYEKENDLDNAILWYKKAISKNYIDYMAHWFLADAYMVKNDIKNAVDEIVIARILNRNNPRIKASMVNIFDKDKRNTEDWNFTPQVNINKTVDNKINVSYNENWINYAMAKALWTYESGYKESMGVPKDKYYTLEDQECLMSMVWEMEFAKNKIITKDTQLTILKKAFFNKRINEYIMYEIVLPQSPSVAYQLTEEGIFNIKDYILNVRNTKKD